MTNDPTPSWQQLIDWIEGRLSPADAVSIEQQAERAGESTAADVAWIRAFLRAGKEIVIEEPPAQLRSALQARFNKYVSEQRIVEPIDEHVIGGPNLVQRFLAVLTFDSGLQPGLAGARASDVENVRQLIFSTSMLDISLSVRHEMDGLHIDGQILPIQDMALDAFHARIQRRDDVVAHASVDAHGLFSFAAIRPDAYKFFLGAEALSVWIESFNLHD